MPPELSHRPLDKWCPIKKVLRLIILGRTERRDQRTPTGGTCHPREGTQTDHAQVGAFFRLRASLQKMTSFPVALITLKCSGQYYCKMRVARPLLTPKLFTDFDPSKLDQNLSGLKTLQNIEQLCMGLFLRNEKVAGSIPVGSTTKPLPMITRQATDMLILKAKTIGIYNSYAHVGYMPYNTHKCQEYPVHS